jgi:hypothetical protein
MPPKELKSGSVTNKRTDLINTHALTRHPKELKTGFGHEQKPKHLINTTHPTLLLP